MKNISLAIVIVLVAASALWLLAASKSNNAPAGGAAVSQILPGSFIAEPESFDFGSISMAKGKVKTTFALRNDSAEPITISRIFTSCMCTSASLLLGERRIGPFGMPGHGIIPRIDQEIPPGAEAALEVVFDPAAHGPAGVGNITRAVSLETPSGTREVQIAVTVTP